MRQESLCNGNLAEDVHLELPAQLIQRDELERNGKRDARVVDEPVQLTDMLRRRPHLVLVGDVEQDLLGASWCVPCATDAGEDTPACTPRDALRRPRRFRKTLL